MVPMEDEEKIGTEIEKELQGLLTHATEQEQKARRRAFYLTVIPAAMALILLMGTGLQIRASRQAVSMTKAELGAVENDLLSARLELDNTYEDLADANLEVVKAHESLTDTLVTLEKVTGDLVASQSQLARSEVEMKALQDEVISLKDRITVYNQQILDLNQQIEDLQKSLDSVREELKAATDLKRYSFSGDWMQTLKFVSTAFPQAGGLLQTIVENQDTSWFTGGFSVNQGFDSPSFAAYVLELNERLTLNNPADRYNLRALLPANRGTPTVGDLVFYEGGYTMFYFIDEQGVPFVIGMTTQGILALVPDFAQIKGYASPGL